MLDCGLDDSEFVTAKPGDEIGLPNAAAQTRRHDFQQFIADMMTERIVDALELVDVEIKQCKLIAPINSLELLLDLLTEHYPIRQVGQRVVMREVRDPLFGPPTLRDITYCDTKYPFAGCIDWTYADVS